MFIEKPLTALQGGWDVLVNMSQVKAIHQDDIVRDNARNIHENNESDCFLIKFEFHTGEDIVWKFLDPKDRDKELNSITEKVT